MMGQDDILEDPLSIKDTVKEEERNSLDMQLQDEILKDSFIQEGKYIPNILERNIAQ